jgi:hypothetical protein
MKPSERLFRSLIIASVLTACASGVIDYLFPDLIPPALQTVKPSVTFDTLRIADIVLAVACIPIGLSMIASIIGLYQFRPWAPRLALYTTVGLVALFPFISFSVNSGWAGMFGVIDSLLWGAVITMAYFSPIHSKFLKNGR